jgi:hypothetical protein
VGQATTDPNAALAGAQLTKLTAVDDKKVDRGEGLEFLQDYPEKKVNFFNADVKVCLRIRSIWFQDGKAGLSLAATNLVLRRMVEVDPFGDDAELLA